jgi:phosphatidylserine decarboxylase
MRNTLLAYAQYLLPQQALSALVGRVADSRLPWLKNTFIRWFIKHYPVAMQEAIIEDPFAYPSFNEFFIRHLKPNARPLDQATGSIVSPVDGSVTQVGSIHAGQLLQAKKHWFDLCTLLGGDQKQAQLFEGGQFATLYLAPHQYHRVHMPLAGTLTQTCHVPGRLFSVNATTTQCIPHLYNQNERLVALFDTACGPMALILVGALIVGSIQPVWPHPAKHTPHLHLKQGEEMGHFKLGSTVIVLFGKDTMQWQPTLQPGSPVLMGSLLGRSI